MLRFESPKKELRMKVLVSSLTLLCAFSAFADGWTDISAAIAGRKAQMVPASVSEPVSAAAAVGPVRAIASAEYVAEGRVLDTFFWFEAFSAFYGISPRHSPGTYLTFK